jgi:hypothetical protein
MDVKDLVGFGVSFVGMAFGFGRQSGEIKNLRRDVDNIGSDYREILRELQEINKKLERFDQRILHIERD